MGTAAMKITFLTRALDFGGAERQLVELARGLHARGHQIKVVVFYAGGPLERDLHEAGVPVVVLSKRGRYDLLGFNVRLARALRAGKPDIVHGYLGGPNVMAAVLKPFHRAKVIWGIRASAMDGSRYSWWSRLDGSIERRIAQFPDLAISNSHAGKAHAVANGYPSRKIVVIPNGVDTARFHPDPDGRARIRNEFGIAPSTPLIGRVGRIDPQKDYVTFLEMAKIVGAARPDARFICVGKGDPVLETELRERAERLGLADRVIWAGARGDMSAIYSALDLSVSSSSYGEGTPNVVAESMACGVPCLVTDIGDSAWTAGGFGAVAPAEQPDALARAVLESLARIERGLVDLDAVRESIVARLSLALLYERTEAALAHVLGPERATAARIRNEAAT
jgi:glycosyltransferase involved in cell wall biosynthesis